MGIKRKYHSNMLYIYVDSDDRLSELASIIHEHAPDAIKQGEIKNHFGRKVAIVSSHCLSHLTWRY